MKYIHYLYIVAFAFLVACSSEEQTLSTDNNVEMDDGTVKLSAGIAEGGQSAKTRVEDDARHATHLAFTPTTTELALRVSGTWTSSNVIKYTTATVGAENNEGSKHNAVECSPVIFWEDYGSADPANTAGRTEGLTIYGTAVNNKSLTAASIGGLITTDALWNAIPWVLDADQTATNKTPTDKDLLISNNAIGGDNTPYEGRYRFDNRYDGKLLEFKHALSKITVNLKPGAGFTSGFTSTPEVILTSKDGTDATTSTEEWARITGKVNVFTGAVDLTGDGQGIRSTIKMCDAPLSTTAQTAGYTVAKEALVMPGSEFTSDDAIIARINADNNIYYVTAQKIRNAINATAHATADPTVAGKNYIINVQVNQTDISVVVTATVANWTDVSAEEVAPVINLIGNLGDAASDWGADNAFSFYRSTSLNNGYSSTPASLKVGNYYAEESVLSYDYDAATNKWSMTPVLYWPDHNTHYQFRAVWPQTGTDTGEQTYPRVEDGTGTTSGYQVIKVKNVAYSAGSFPSDLMIARPNVENEDGNCGSKESDAVHPKKNLFIEGICARTGSIDLTFKYMMSQVEVNLSTSDGSDQVNLTKAKVEIINVYNTGDVTLGNREVIPTGDKGSYTIDYVSGNNYHSAIVPQALTYTSALHLNNVMFRITIYKNGDPSQGVDDIYYADINPILKQSSSDKVAPNGAWESGYHYVYNLRLTKTGVKVTASLTNWTTVNADHTVWF